MAIVTVVIVMAMVMSGMLTEQNHGEISREQRTDDGREDSVSPFLISEVNIVDKFCISQFEYPSTIELT